jgi:glycosyltransferase involved in cell wall biosynthesis
MPPSPAYWCAGFSEMPSSAEWQPLLSDIPFLRKLVCRPCRYRARARRRGLPDGRLVRDALDRGGLRDAFLEAMASGTPALGLAVGGARDALADGELGMAVTEPELLSALARALEQPKPNGHALAAAVRARFGRERFGVGAHAVLNRLIVAA